MKSRANTYAHMLAVGLASGAGVKFINRQQEPSTPEGAVQVQDAAARKRQRKAAKRLQAWTGTI